MMLPLGFFDIGNVEKAEKAVEKKEFSSRTYDLLNMNSRLDGKEAVVQAVMKILNTEKSDFGIYSDRYGVSVSDLFGTDADYACVELERRIQEALLYDSRVKSVTEFRFKVKCNAVSVSFIVNTELGEDFSVTKEIKF